jgi:hypothetical protein
MTVWSNVVFWLISGDLGHALCAAPHLARHACLPCIVFGNDTQAGSVTKQAKQVRQLAMFVVTT